MLDRLAGLPQASQRPPAADNVDVNIGAVTGGEIGAVLLMPVRQAGEVCNSASPRLASGQSMRPVPSSPSENTWLICRWPCAKTAVQGRSMADCVQITYVPEHAHRDCHCS